MQVSNNPQTIPSTLAKKAQSADHSLATTKEEKAKVKAEVDTVTISGEAKVKLAQDNGVGSEPPRMKKDNGVGSEPPRALKDNGVGSEPPQ